MELFVEGRSPFVGKHQERLRVTREQKVVTEVPLFHLKQVIIVDRGVGLSSDVVRMCCEEGIPIHFLNGRGRAVASLYSAGLTGTVLTRRAHWKEQVEQTKAMLQTWQEAQSGHAQVKALTASILPYGCARLRSYSLSGNLLQEELQDQ
ncbi:MAG TPA: CRISPR-associated endonuclease Cas1 [Ktedonobacteraceae bacterium]|nr:CRISPR-associated endonuclease Cas1 [Ktedonobacteraceae bacterium]